MSKVSITRSLLDDLAMSISAKSGEAVPMTLTEMKDAVDSIQTGGDITVESLSVTSNGTYTAPTGKAYTPVTVSVPTPTPSLQTKTKTYTPTESAQTETVSADSGYDGIDTVSISVGAIDSEYIGSAIDRRSSSDIHFFDDDGYYVAGPPGFYDGNISVEITSGSAGTPTATKGTVSNHQVSVTPSVTNTTGYISGGTKNGTAVTVSASELVSGTYTVDSSGTKNVTNYASASVPAGTAGTPSASKGAVSNHSVSVTPSVTNQTGWITGSTKTGTAVTVTASELVSGSETKTENGTYDVTNLSEIVVNVSGGGSVTWETIYDGNVSIVADSPNYVVINNWAPTHPIFADGQTWRVTWNGTEYVCPVKVQQGTAYIGNAQNIGYSDTSSEPFFAYMRTSTQLSFATTDSAGSITLKMELQHDTSATLIEKTITANGTYDAEDDSADGYSKVTVDVPTSGSSKNTQVVQGTTRTTSSTLTAIGAEMTVSKTGTYDVYWSAFRSSTSASYTYGTQLYVDGTAYGTQNTTWSNHVQDNHLTGVSLTANQKIRVYGRNSRGSSYYIYAPTLVIVEA